MRDACSVTLFSDPDLLILDEPSNHLDLEAQLWLTEHLKKFRNTVLMVSHDRDLLNDVCDHIVHIDQEKLVAYTGNYDFFEKTRAERLANDAAQQQKIAAQRKHMQAFVDRFKGKSTFIRLISQKLEPREGKLKKTPKLKVGYFSQDQEEGLDFEATPYDHMAIAMGPGVPEHKVRAQLGRFGFSRDRGNLKVGV